jgi:small multidrug resistance family-3 protein
MERLLIIGSLFVLAGLYEIGGGYLVWGWMRDHKPLLWGLLGALILAAYGVVAALQPISEFGRVYAAYGGCSSRWR